MVQMLARVNSNLQVVFRLRYIDKILNSFYLFSPSFIQVLTFLELPSFCPFVGEVFKSLICVDFCLLF